MEEIRSEFALDVRYKAGDTSLFSERYEIPRFAEANKWNFNLILHYVNMMSGEQRQNRKDLVSLPRKVNPDQDQRLISEIRSSCMRHVLESADMIDLASDWFEDSTTMGLSWLFFFRDYSKDPQFGQLRSQIMAYDEVIFDPDFTQTDLSDCDYIWVNKMLSREELKERFPDEHKLIDELPSGVRFNDLNKRDRLGSLPMKDHDKLEYNEFHYRTTRPATFLIHPVSREAVELPSDLEEDKVEAKRLGFEIIDKTVPCWNQGIVIANEEIYDGKNSLNIDQAPFVPSICYLNRNSDDYAQKFQGIPRALRDTQFIFTYQTIMQFKMIELQINQGIKYKPSSLVDPEVPLDSGMDFKVAMKRDSNMQDFETIPRQPIDPTIVSMKESLIGLAERITGIGSQDQGHNQQGDPSGISEILRHAKTRIPWQAPMDRFDQSFRQVGRIVDSYVANNWTSERVFVATGQAPPEGWNLPFVNRYDISIREGAYTATQQQAQFQQYASLMAMGAPLQWSDLLKTAPLIYSREVIERVAEAEKKSTEMAQQKQELELARDKSDLELKQASSQALQAKAMNEQSSAQAKITKVESEVEYKKSLSAESDARSVTQMVKAMETLNKIDVSKLELLHSIDVDQVNILLDIAKTLKQDKSDGQDGIRQEGREDGSPESSGEQEILEGDEL